MRQSGLQRIVMRVGVGSEVFEISRRDANIWRTERGILHGGIHDCAGHWRNLGLQISATLSGNDDGILRRGQRGLIGIVGRAQSGTLGADVSEFREPIAT